MRYTQTISIRIGIIVAILVMAMSMAAAPVAAQGVPPGATITSATFSIYVTRVSNQTIRVHRITDPWTETGVTWSNFGGAFDPSVEGSFVADSTGWKSVNVTSLVQAWQDGTYPNYGLLLEQGGTAYTTYHSSEWGTVAERPKLDICYTVDTSEETCVTIQRGTDGDVIDAYIWQASPDYNGGSSSVLYTGLLGGGEKQTLLQFDFAGAPPAASGTGTPGYWKNHPEAWPVGNITIGGITYGKDQAIEVMQTPEKGDKTRTMFRALVAAKLNVLAGNDSSCIGDTITAADAWMATYGPVGSKVKAHTKAWKVGEPLYTTLDQYNNGDLCAPSRDDLE